MAHDKFVANVVLQTRKAARGKQPDYLKVELRHPDADRVFISNIPGKVINPANVMSCTLTLIRAGAEVTSTSDFSAVSPQEYKATAHAGIKIAFGRAYSRLKRTGVLFQTEHVLIEQAFQAILNGLEDVELYNG